MHHSALKPFIIYALGAAVIAGCKTTSGQTEQGASREIVQPQTSIQSGRIIAMFIPLPSGLEREDSNYSSDESTSAGGMSAGSSAAGGGNVGTITVLFDDGTQAMYSVVRPDQVFAVGAPVRIFNDASGVTIMSP